MSAIMNCPACHHAIHTSELAFCAACGAPLAMKSGQLSEPRLNALEMWTGWDGLMVSQEAAMSYWFMARRDYAHLRKLIEAWNASDDPVRRLLAAKLDRALVSDPDQFPHDAVSLGARLAFRFRGDVHQRVLVDPVLKAHLPGALSVASPLGALLLGMLEGGSLRAQDPDGASFSVLVEKVEQPESLRALTVNEAARRKLAS
jgi:transcription elongation GreA/GreB family factor